jgi:hypothetical protein
MPVPVAVEPLLLPDLVPLELPELPELVPELELRPPEPLPDPEPELVAGRDPLLPEPELLPEELLLTTLPELVPEPLPEPLPPLPLLGVLPVAELLFWLVPPVVVDGGGFQGVGGAALEHSQAPAPRAATTQAGAINPIFLIVTSSNRDLRNPLL